MTGRFTTRQDEANPVVCAPSHEKQFPFGHVINLLFTKCSVNMTGYWAGSFPRFNGPQVGLGS